jgi:hypothetical protein
VNAQDLDLHQEKNDQEVVRLIHQF